MPYVLAVFLGGYAYAQDSGSENCEPILAAPSLDTAELEKVKEIFYSVDAGGAYVPQHCQFNILRFFVRLREQGISLDGVSVLYLTAIQGPFFSATLPRDPGGVTWPYHVVAKIHGRIFDFDNRERFTFPSEREYFQTMFRRQRDKIGYTEVPGEILFKHLYKKWWTDFSLKMNSPEIRQNFRRVRLSTVLSEPAKP